MILKNRVLATVDCLLMVDAVFKFQAFENAKTQDLVPVPLFFLSAAILMPEFVFFSGLH